MHSTRRTIAWALYDWANSSFALSVLAVLFPLVLRNHWSAGDDAADVTARLAWITFAASAIVCISAPLFGTIADAGGYRKKFLLVLAIVGAVSTAALGFVGAGNWQLALGVYLFAQIGYYTSVVFYDSLLIDATEPRYYSFVSTLGFSLGYLGGAVLLALHLWMLKDPAQFGLDNTVEAFNMAFVSVGAWWLIFLVPLWFFVSERHSAIEVTSGAVRAAYRELRSTLRQVAKYRNVAVFLTGYWLYVGGVFTIIVMAVDYGKRLGFADEDLVLALLITNFRRLPGDIAIRSCRAALRPQVGHLLRVACLCRRVHVGSGHDDVPGVHDHGDHHRLRAGRCAGPEPVAVCDADSQGPARGVLRLLQHDDKVRTRDRAVDGRYCGTAVGQPQVDSADADAAFPGGRLAADARARAGRR